MTNEELDIKAREHAKDYSGAMWATARESYIMGFRDAEEKTRWIPVTERLPEIKKKGYWVLVKDGKKADPETFNISDARDIEVLENWYTHWKKIL